MQKTQIKNEHHKKSVEFQDNFNIHHILDEIFQPLAVMPNCKTSIMKFEAGTITSDIITTSLQKSDFIALSETLHTAINEKNHIIIFSSQVCKKQLIQHMLAIYAQVDLSSMQNPSLLQPEEWQKLFEAVNEFRNASIFIDDTDIENFMELQLRAQCLKREHNFSVIIIDSSKYIVSRKNFDLCKDDLHTNVFFYLKCDINLLLS